MSWVPVLMLSTGLTLSAREPTLDVHTRQIMNKIIIIVLYP